MASASSRFLPASRKSLRPTVVEVLVPALLGDKARRCCRRRAALQHDAEFLLRVIMLTRLATDILADRLRRRLIGFGFLSHLRLSNAAILNGRPTAEVFGFPARDFLIQGRDADSRSPSDRREGRLRRFSRQAEGRRRHLYDGRHRPVGVFAVFHAVGVVSCPISVRWRKASKTSNCHTLFGMTKIPTDNHIRSMLDPVHPSHLQGLVRSSGCGAAGEGRHEGVRAPWRPRADRPGRNRIFLFVQARLSALPDAQALERQGRDSTTPCWRRPSSRPATTWPCR